MVCNADARRVLGLLDGAAPADFRTRVEAVPMESPVLKVNFALSGLPQFPAAEHATRGTVNCMRGAQAMHDACRLAQAGDVADELWCELYFQTVADPSVAPEGRHVMSAFCQYVPYELAEGTWDERRDEMADRVERSIERFAPGFRELVVEHARRSPRPTSSARSGSPAATSSRASACPSSCGTGGCPTAPAPTASTCAVRARIPAAA